MHVQAQYSTDVQIANFIFISILSSQWQLNLLDLRYISWDKSLGRQKIGVAFPVTVLGWTMLLKNTCHMMCSVYTIQK